MGGVLAIALLAAWAAPAPAGFRYVPPADPVSTQAEEASDGNAAARDTDPAPATGRTVWRVHAGETLREALARWGGRAGADVVFLTDRRYRLEGEAAFQGGFADAAQALFESLSHLPHPPEGAFSTDRRSLAVTHRQTVPTKRGGKP